MTPEMERVLSAFRERMGGRLVPSAAWRDLSPNERERAAAEVEVQRRLEAALDPEGFSTTVVAVLDRIA